MERKKNLDIIKAIAIILMVLAHSGFKFSRWIYQFHMSVFFIIAGYCLTDKYFKTISGIKLLLKKRIKSLYFPCLIFNLTITLLHNYLVKINFTEGYIYSAKTLKIAIFKCILFSGGEHLSGAMWFLRTMFFSTIIFAFIKYLSKNIKYFDWIISIIFLIISWKLCDISFGKYLNIFTVIILYQIGFSLKNININFNIKKNFICCFIGFFALILSYFLEYRNISLTNNHIINPYIFIYCSIFGFIMLYGFSNILEKTKISDLLQYIGKNTLPIVMFHFIAMKFVTFLEIIIYKKNINLMKVHPYLYNNGLWIVIYTISGICIPLFLDWSYKKIKNILKKEG